MGTTEATETFFAITKLFQSKDPVLRRMVYLGIKDLSGIAEDVIIVTSSLTKDMTGMAQNQRYAVSVIGFQILVRFSYPGSYQIYCTFISV